MVTIAATVRAGVCLGLLVVVLAAPFATAAKFEVSLAQPLGKFPVRSTFPATQLVWANLTWSGSSGGIVFDGSPSTAPEGSATPPETVRDVQLTANDATWGMTRYNIAPLLQDEVFTSAPLSAPLYLNVSQHIHVDLYVKGVGDNAKPCQTSGNSQSNTNPALNVELWAGEMRVAGWSSVGYTPATNDGPLAWGICRHRLAPEVHVIPAESRLTLRVTHVKQDTVYLFGFASDYRSVIRFPVFPMDELVYRHPEFFEAAEPDPDAPAAQIPYWIVLPLLLGARARRSAAAVLVLVLAGAAMAGCVSPAKDKTTPPGGVGDGEFTNTFIPLPTGDDGSKPGRGSIYGLVHDDLHLPVPSVHVALVGRSEFTQTDGKGQFKFQDLPAGKYRMRLDKVEYRSFEFDVEVRAGFVSKPTIQLELTNPKSRDARPHVHNGWVAIPEGRKTLMDADLDLRCDAQNRCRTYNDFIIPGKGSEPNAIIPGTQDVRVTLTWSDPALGSRLGLAVHSPIEQSSTWALYTPRESGKPFMIPVSWERDDPGHQLVSSWRFQVFRAPPDYPTAADEKRQDELPSGGRIHAKVEIFRGGALPLEPAHPDHWKGLNTYTVFKDAKKTPPSCAAATLGQCSYAVQFRPEGKIVPPGTKRIVLEVEASRDELPPFEWELYVQSAAVPYTNPAERGLGTYQKVARDSSSFGTKYKWTVNVQDHEADGEYAKLSGWTFVLHPSDTTMAFISNLPASTNAKVAGTGLTMNAVAQR